MTMNCSTKPPISSNITLLARDFNYLYAYWEISQSLKDMVKKHFSQQWEEVELRVILTELSSGVATPVLEYIPSKEVNRHYFEVPDWQRIKAELGFNNHGSFVMLLTSDTVYKYDYTNFKKSVIIPPISPLGISSGFRS